MFFRKPAQPESPQWLRYTLEARMYEFEDRYFVCSVRGISETESLTLLQTNVADEALGEAVLKHLHEYDPTIGDMIDKTLRDWPAFQASGARSIRAFESTAWHINLAAMNSALLVWARPRISLKDISAYSTANKIMAADIGATIRETISAAKALREQGVI